MMSVEAAMRWVQWNGRVARGTRYSVGLSAALAIYARQCRTQGNDIDGPGCESSDG